MFRSWKLGTAFGIGIYVHWTFLLLPAWVLLSNWGLGGLPLALFLVTLVLAVFGCVVLHELGHALMARYFGIGTRDITLYPIGGVARLERMSERPWEEFWIALAGPAVNVGIVGLLLAVLALLGLGTVATPTEVPLLSLGESFLWSLLYANAGLVVFNLLPAFPMDGGRVLRALLSLGMGRLRATEVAAKAGVVMAVLMAVGALFVSAPMLIFVAAFVFLAGQQELAALRHREAMRHDEPLEVLPAEPAIDVRPVPVESGFTGLQWSDRLGAWVMWRNGRPVAAYHARAD